MIGENLTNQFRRLVFDANHDSNFLEDWKVVRDVKEKLCFVALDYEAEVECKFSAIQLITNHPQKMCCMNCLMPMLLMFQLNDLKALKFCSNPICSDCKYLEFIKPAAKLSIVATLILGKPFMVTLF